MGLTLTRSRALALGLRPSAKKEFATEVEAFVTSAAEAVATERRQGGGRTYLLLRADGRGDNLLEVLQSERRRGRKKELLPEEQEFLERRRGAIVREAEDEVQVEFFLHPDETEERWRSVRALTSEGPSAGRPGKHSH